MTMYYSYLETPIGKLLLVGENGALVHVEFEKRGHAIPPDPAWREDNSALRPQARQLTEYFRGKRRAFDIELDLRGTDFQIEVWNALLDIPYGETISYGELAGRIGRPNASRAVGAANGKNPIPIIIPCHRVIGSNGTLTGFGGGLPTKRALLELETNTRDEQLLFE